MQPEKFDALQKEAWASRKSIAEVINEALDVRLGWHPELFEKKAAGKK